MTVYHQFFSNLGNCQYHFKSGNTAKFRNGVYRTNNKKEIEELQEQLDDGHPHLYVKQDQLTTEALVDDPLAGLKAKIRADIEAEYAAKLEAEAAATNKQFGDTPKDNLKAANSDDVAPVAMQGGTASAVKAAVSASTAKLTK